MLPSAVYQSSFLFGNLEVHTSAMHHPFNTVGYTLLHNVIVCNIFEHLISTKRKEHCLPVFSSLLERAEQS